MNRHKDFNKWYKRKPYDVKRAHAYNPEAAKGTYLIMSGNKRFNHDHMKKLLDKHGMKEVDVTRAQTESAQFVWVDVNDQGIFDKRSYGIHCQVKNLLDDKKGCITDKESLHYLLQERFPKESAKYLPHTYNVRDTDPDTMDWSNGKVYILRPVGKGKFCGKGIVRVSSPDEFRAAQAEMIKEPTDHAIASEYVTNPFLIDGRKSHIRMYWMVRGATERLPAACSLCPVAIFCTAKKPYVQDNLDDSEIHDSHNKTTDKCVFWPKDMPERMPAEAIPIAHAQAEEIMRCVGEIYTKEAKPFSEATYGFEIFGVDFLMDDKYNMHLIEINDRIGFGKAKNDPDPENRFETFTEEYLQWVYEKAVGPMLGFEPDPFSKDLSTK